MRINKLHYRLLKTGFLLLLILSFCGVAAAQGRIYLPVVAQGAPTPPSQPETDKELAIAKVAAAPEIAPVLANHPHWVADAYPDDEAERIWHVDFYAETDGEHLGYGHVRLNSNELFDIKMPRDLSPAELQAGITAIDAYLPYDAEVQARLGNPKLWYHDVSYDRWEESWKAYYSRGLEEILITLYIDDNNDVYLDAIIDPAVLSEEEAAEERRNRAINLAYSAEGIDEALAGVDNWSTYVEDHGDDQYTVAFSTTERPLYRVHVDIDQERIIEAGP
ncbi:MAG: hypothetical protein DYG89_41055 [Caldilinea sp. CFX5]|nr:hypothetical protein [Caldilinea sp. CFX5]